MSNKSALLSPWRHFSPDPEVDRFHERVVACYRENITGQHRTRMEIWRYRYNRSYASASGVFLGATIDEAKVNYDKILSEYYSLLTEEQFKKLQILL